MILFETLWMYKPIRGYGKFYGAPRVGLVIHKGCLDWWDIPDNVEAVKFIVHDRPSKWRVKIHLHTGNPRWVRATNPECDKFPKLLTGDLRIEARKALEQDIETIFVELYYMETL